MWAFPVCQFLDQCSILEEKLGYFGGMIRRDEADDQDCKKYGKEIFFP